MLLALIQVRPAESRVKFVSIPGILFLYVYIYMFSRQVFGRIRATADKEIMFCRGSQRKLYFRVWVRLRCMIVTRYDEYLLTKWKQWHYEKRGRNRQWDPDILITYNTQIHQSSHVPILGNHPGIWICGLSCVYFHQLFIVFAIHRFDGRREKRAQKRPRPPRTLNYFFLASFSGSATSRCAIKAKP